jgi:DNA-binding response OmpR family regulator
VLDNILLVEDDETLLMTLGDRLRNESYPVNCGRDDNGVPSYDS